MAKNNPGEEGKEQRTAAGKGSPLLMPRGVHHIMMTWWEDCGDIRDGKEKRIVIESDGDIQIKLE